MREDVKRGEAANARALEEIRKLQAAGETARAATAEATRKEAHGRLMKIKAAYGL
jgi:hypothetical protein